MILLARRAVDALAHGRVIVIHLVFYLSVLLYLLCAALIIGYIEQKYRTSEAEQRSFHSSFLLAFEICSTIGYGNQHPRTKEGKICSIVIAILGIPLWLLAVADLGRFLSTVLMSAYKCLRNRLWRCKENFVRRCFRRQKTSAEEFASVENGLEVDGGEPEDRLPVWVVTLLLVSFVLIFAGACSLTKEGIFVEDVYFVVISVSTIGFGDNQPSPDQPPKMYRDLLMFTVGVTLMTLAIDAFVDLFRKFHNFGIKIQGCKDMVFWIGGRKTTVGRFTMKLLKSAGVPGDRIAHVVAGLDDIAEHVQENVPEPTDELFRYIGCQTSASYFELNVCEVVGPAVIVNDIGTQTEYEAVEVEVEDRAVDPITLETHSSSCQTCYTVDSVALQVRPEAVDCGTDAAVVTESKTSQAIPEAVACETQTDKKPAASSVAPRYLAGVARPTSTSGQSKNTSSSTATVERAKHVGTNRRSVTK